MLLLRLQRVLEVAKRLVVIAGNIGAGKTSLTERLGARLGWHAAFESVADNPYLADFYRDMPAWAFHLQVFFLGHRVRQYLDLVASPQSAILDRSIYEDAHIFTRALHHLGSISERDYLSYRRVFDLLVGTLPPPDLLLFLKAPAKILLARIRKRARSIEADISLEYLSLLESYYDEWIASFDLCPVLTLRSDDLDFVHQAKHLDLVIEHIQDKLSGREEMIFPAPSS
jgi:deoxyadenosine/deoxycytidine kinase